MKKIIGILKPTIFYIILTCSLYYLRYFSFYWINFIFTFLIIIIFPMVFLLWNIQIIKNKFKKINQFFIFGICFILGLLVGIQIIYKLSLMQYGYILNEIITPLILSTLVFGMLFGTLGILINHLFSKFKKIPILKLVTALIVGAITGILIFFGAISSISTNVPQILNVLLAFVVILPFTIGTFLCGLINDHTFGCMAVNIYLTPLFYSILVLLIYIFILRRKFLKYPPIDFTQ